MVTDPEPLGLYLTLFMVIELSIVLWQLPLVVSVDPDSTRNKGKEHQVVEEEEFAEELPWAVDTNAACSSHMAELMSTDSDPRAATISVEKARWMSYMCVIDPECSLTGRTKAVSTIVYASSATLDTSMHHSLTFLVIGSVIESI